VRVLYLLMRLPSRLKSEKRCSACRKVLPRSAFYEFKPEGKRLPGGLHSACKACEFQRRNENRRANPAATSAVVRRAKLKRVYGLTVEQYDALLASQDGRCAICKRMSPDGRRLHVDHDHQTRRVRGLLCHDCNRGLGIFKDSADLLAAALDYIRKSD